jgi:class 3 adenylate cyclase
MTAAITFLLAATIGPGMTELWALLDERLDKPAEAARIDGEIQHRFAQPLAVMITDMSGFTDRTKARGIIPFLTTIRELQRLAAPVLQKNGAALVKTDADDLFVIHAQPAPLYKAAQELIAAVKKHDAESDDDIGLGIGLDLGSVLKMGDEDIFGSPVNVASKLGEDTAKAGEILVSVEFYKALESAGVHAACKRIEAGARATKFPFYECH